MVQSAVVEFDGKMILGQMVQSNVAEFVVTSHAGGVHAGIVKYNIWNRAANAMRSMVCTSRYARLGGWAPPNFASTCETFKIEIERFWVEYKWLCVDNVNENGLLFPARAKDGFFATIADQIKTLENDHNRIVNQAVAGRYCPWLVRYGSGSESEEDVRTHSELS